MYQAWEFAFLGAGALYVFFKSESWSFGVGHNPHVQQAEKTHGEALRRQLINVGARIKISRSWIHGCNHLATATTALPPWSRLPQTVRFPPLNGPSSTPVPPPAADLFSSRGLLKCPTTQIPLHGLPAFKEILRKPINSAVCCELHAFCSNSCMSWRKQSHRWLKPSTFEAAESVERGYGAVCEPISRLTGVRIRACQARRLMKLGLKLTKDFNATAEARDGITHRNCDIYQA
ncbi:hypothetical protein K438DRAFT_1778792 [Mycena galopus ATCC 62051]|nr:hypothetical protein K438DRAFT_1778792 [Mycena galopus ATCC 62051]